MSPMQWMVLTLVFVVVVTAVLGVGALLKPDPARQRLRAIEGGDPARAPSGDRLMQVVADLTRPISRLSMPEEGFEKSSIRLRFVHAGCRRKASRSPASGCASCTPASAARSRAPPSSA